MVCWRACVVWRKNHFVKAVCSVFLLATFSKFMWMASFTFKCISRFSMAQF